VIRPHDLAFERMLDRGRDAAVDDSSGQLPDSKGAKRTAVDDFERDYLSRLMAKASGNLANAAALAGIERDYLRSLLKRHGLRSRE
jgi:transcriptional regulator with GAF, ATPase, and Fis domain